MKVYILIRSCVHTGRMIVYAKDSTEAIKVANRLGDDWVILREIDSTFAQILHYEP